MTRTLTITAAEWANVQHSPAEGSSANNRHGDGTLWLVRDGVKYWFGTSEHDHRPGPPAEFVQACAPCARCKDTRTIHPQTFPTPCPYCRIELVGPCRTCGKPGCEGNRPVTLGYGYAVGEALPIVDRHRKGGSYLYARWGEVRLVIPGFGQQHITDQLAHYSDGRALVGRWALKVQVVPS